LSSLVAAQQVSVNYDHGASFAQYHTYAWGSNNTNQIRCSAGRKPLSREVRDLIFRMVVENPTWGAPRIHAELLKLGFDVPERTVSCWNPTCA
jgi:hypothetical protein